MRSFLLKTFVVVLATSANLALGLYWYGTEFSRQWTAASHHSVTEFSHPTYEQLAVAAIGSAITAIALLAVGRRLAGKNAGFFRREGTAVVIATVAWFGFAAATAAKHYAFLGHSQELLALDYGYDLAGMVVMALIVAVVQ